MTQQPGLSPGLPAGRTGVPDASIKAGATAQAAWGRPLQTRSQMGTPGPQQGGGSAWPQGAGIRPRGRLPVSPGPRLQSSQPHDPCQGDPASAPALRLPFLPAPPQSPAAAPGQAAAADAPGQPGRGRHRPPHPASLPGRSRHCRSAPPRLEGRQPGADKPRGEGSRGRPPCDLGSAMLSQGSRHCGNGSRLLLPSELPLPGRGSLAGTSLSARRGWRHACVSVAMVVALLCPAGHRGTDGG